jgi:hypothetical protein
LRTKRHIPIQSVAVATVVAAALSGAPSTAHALATGADPMDSVRAAASLVGAPHRSTATSVALGGLVHVAVSAFWGLVLARLLPPGRRGRFGVAAGVAIYVLDLGILAQARPLRAIRELPQLPQLADHITFGWLLGVVLDRSETHAEQPPKRLIKS